MDAVGNSVGILTVWDPTLFKVLESSKHEGFVVIKGVWKDSQISLGIINVYALQSVSKRKVMWLGIHFEEER